MIPKLFSMSLPKIFCNLRNLTLAQMISSFSFTSSFHARETVDRFPVEFTIDSQKHSTVSYSCILGTLKNILEEVFSLHKLCSFMYISPK